MVFQLRRCGNGISTEYHDCTFFKLLLIELNEISLLRKSTTALLDLKHPPLENYACGDRRGQLERFFILHM